MGSHLPTILVVDDNRAELNYARVVLEGAGYRVISCEVSVELIKMLRAHRPDLVLLDVRMPYMDGDSLCGLVRPITSSKIILYSGMEQEQLEQLVEQSGADGYIRKTEDPEALIASVRCFLTNE